MGIFKMIADGVKKGLAKTFDIPLEDVYTFPAEKDYICPDLGVQVEAIRRFVESNGEGVEFLSTHAPITFLLNGKETYQAEVKRGVGRYQSGNYLKCTQVK